MGVRLKEILEYEIIEVKNLQNKTFAIDAFNMIYQFLSSIRQADGSHLTDRKGNITSHLKGLFSRLVFFKKNNLKIIFTFDGTSNELKTKEKILREKKKEEAREKYEKAILENNLSDMKKYSQNLNYLTKEMLEEVKKLIELFGFVSIDSLSEGEAQGAQLLKEKKCSALISQDFDSLLFGANFLIRNLSISNKRKIPGTSIYKDVPIEFYNLQKNLEKLNINQKQLITIAILCGTDFNPLGIKGIGPKTALKLVKENPIEKVFQIVKWEKHFDFSYKEIFEIFENPKVKKNEEVNFLEMEKEKIINFLGEKDFDKESIKNSLSKIQSETNLNKFF